MLKILLISNYKYVENFLCILFVKKNSSKPSKIQFFFVLYSFIALLVSLLKEILKVSSVKLRVSTK